MATQLDAVEEAVTQEAETQEALAHLELASAHDTSVPNASTHRVPSGGSAVVAAPLGRTGRVLDADGSEPAAALLHAAPDGRELAEDIVPADDPWRRGYDWPVVIWIAVVHLGRWRPRFSSPGRRWACVRFCAG